MGSCGRYIAEWEPSNSSILTVSVKSFLFIYFLLCAERIYSYWCSPLVVIVVCLWSISCHSTCARGLLIPSRAHLDKHLLKQMTRHHHSKFRGGHHRSWMFMQICFISSWINTLSPKCVCSMFSTSESNTIEHLFDDLQWHRSCWTIQESRLKP